MPLCPSLSRGLSRQGVDKGTGREVLCWESSCASSFSFCLSFFPYWKKRTRDDPLGERRYPVGSEGAKENNCIYVWLTSRTNGGLINQQILTWRYSSLQKIQILSCRFLAEQSKPCVAERVNKLNCLQGQEWVVSSRRGCLNTHGKKIEKGVSTHTKNERPVHVPFTLST